MTLRHRSPAACFWAVMLISLSCGVNAIDTVDSVSIDAASSSLVKAEKASEGATQVSDFGSCDCDLTKGGCDAFCCCDADCEENSPLVSVCMETGLPETLPWCDEKKVVRSTNGVKTLSSSPLCVRKENNPATGDYHVEDLKEYSAADIEAKASTQNRSAQIPSFSERDVVGLYQPFPARLDSKPAPPAGYFSILMPDTSGQCTKSPVLYGVPVDTTCTQSLPTATPSLATCASGAYTQDVAAILGQSIAGRALPSYSESSHFLQVQIASTSASNTSSCFVYTAVDLRLVMNSGVVSKALALVSIADIPTNTSITAAQLNVKVSFHQSEAAALAFATNARSGNPGYEVGKPVRAGAKVSTGGGLGVNRQVPGWSIPAMAKSAGSCFADADANVSRPFAVINFGTDVVLGCNLQMDATSFNSECVRSGLNPAFSLVSELAVGKWGNADPNNIEQWVTLSPPQAPAAASLSASGTCQDIVTAVKYTVLFSPQGHRTNPQNKIVAVSASYEQSTIYPPSSSAGSVVSIPLTTSVVFVRVPPEDSQLVLAQAPRLAPPLPDDIFFPFSSSPASQATAPGLLLALVVGFATVLMVLV